MNCFGPAQTIAVTSLSTYRQPYCCAVPNQSRGGMFDDSRADHEDATVRIPCCPEPVFFQ